MRPLSGRVLFFVRSGAEFLRAFSVQAAGVHSRLSGNQEELTLEYKPSFSSFDSGEAISIWQEKLSSIRSQEVALGISMVGPHRDDIRFLVNKRPARSFGSEGQKRTAAVSFKLAEIPYIQDHRGQKPICLLDDVLSELDAKRASHLLDELSRTGQCFVTLTGLESWPPEKERPASIFYVDESRVRRDVDLAPQVA